MDSKLLIGPVFPTPDPTSRTPWNITSISPRRPMELSSMATTVSIALQLLISPFLFKWLSLDCTGEPLRVASMRKGGENVNQPTQMGKKRAKELAIFFIQKTWDVWEWECARCHLSVNEWIAAISPCMRICALFIQRGTWMKAGAQRKSRHHRWFSGLLRWGCKEMLWVYLGFNFCGESANQF